MSNEGVTERDYTGAATWEVATVYERYSDCDLRTFAARIDMDERTLKQIVVSQKYPFQGLSTVDKICIGLGQSLHDLVDRGELHIIPARGSRNAALRMVEDSILTQHEEIVYANGIKEVKDLIEMGVPVPTTEEIDAKITEILRLRGEYAIVSPEQAERLRRESERSSVRLARKREEARSAA